MYIPELYQVLPTKDFRVYLYYDNGEIRLYDCNWIKKENGIFEKIHNVNDFMNLCTIMNGTLAFDTSGKRDPYNCIDICPDTLYEDSLACENDILSA